MVPQKIIAVVEDVDAARSAVRWAVRNLVRNGDLLTLLHVFPSSRSKNKQKQRTRRLNGFQLALSFKDLCVGVPEVKVEIIVTEGDQWSTITSLVKETGATTLVIGLHDKSFLYGSAAACSCINSLNCRLLAVKQPSATAVDSSINAEFSQIETCLTAKKPMSDLPNLSRHDMQIKEKKGKEVNTRTLSL